MKFTFRELLDMAVGRLRSQWEQTAQITFEISKSVPYKENQRPGYAKFNPFYEAHSDAIELTNENAILLKREFTT